MLYRYKHPIIPREVQTKVRGVLETGLLSGYRGSGEGHLGGPNVRALEETFCQYFNIKHAVAMNSATACLHAALIACDVGLGDSVIVSPYTFSSSASCALMVNATPVFADIEAETFNIDPDKVEDKVGFETQAIIPVHLHGHPADMDRIMRIARQQRLFVIEDAAQAIGAKYKGKYAGTIGDCGIFSFNQSKQISSGEGGMLITNNARIARIARAVRNHGEVSDPELRIVGYNYRLCEVEALLVLEQFKKLNEMLEIRRDLTSLMSEWLKGVGGFIPPKTMLGCEHSFYTYAVKFDKEYWGFHRDVLQQRLAENGVYFGGGYVKPLYMLPIYKPFGYGEGLCPVSERMWKNELLVTDIFKYPMVEEDVKEIIKIFERTLKECQSLKSRNLGGSV